MSQEPVRPPSLRRRSPAMRDLAARARRRFAQRPARHPPTATERPRRRLMWAGGVLALLAIAIAVLIAVWDWNWFAAHWSEPPRRGWIAG